MAVITINEDIKQEIAEKVAEQAHPGYSKDAQGEWYVVNGEKVVHAQSNRPWDPWNEDDEVVSVDDLVWCCGGGEQDHADFDPTPDPSGINSYPADPDEAEKLAWELAVGFALGYVPDSYDPATLPYEEEY